jgi:O-acetyl-ADP-ribose deacetylase (regulator of RNase III)
VPGPPVADRCEFCGLPQPWSPERLTSKRRTPPRRWDPEPQDPSEPKARDPAVRVYPVNKRKPRRQLLVIDDDITNLAVQAIVSNDDVDGRMYTVVASTIRAAAGQQVEDLSIDHGRASLGEAWFTHAGRLSRLKGIIHVAAVNRRGKTKISVIRKCVKAALDKAVEQGCESVALATFGVERATADREVITPETWFNEVVPVIVKYLNKLPRSTRLAVLLVLFEPEDLDKSVKQVRHACTLDVSSETKDDAPS